MRRRRGNTSDICRMEGIGFLHPKKKAFTPLSQHSALFCSAWQIRFAQCIKQHSAAGFFLEINLIRSSPALSALHVTRGGEPSVQRKFVCDSVRSYSGYKSVQTELMIMITRQFCPAQSLFPLSQPPRVLERNTRHLRAVST